MYLTNRFFWLFGALVTLFGLAYPFGLLLPLAQTVFFAALALVGVDVMLLFLRRPQVDCRRSLNVVFH